MNTLIRGLIAATALAGLATPALADRTDKVVVQQYRDKIVSARGEPGVAQYGGAELDRAMAALPGLEKRLRDRKPAQVQAATTEIDTLIATARTRAQAETARRDAVDARAANAAQVAGAETAAANARAEADRARAQAEGARAEADRARADADRTRQQLAEYQMKQTALGATLVLQDVVFQTGRAELKPGAEARLRPLAGYLNANPTVRVRIDGHTDSQGADAANMALSQARAASVRAALATLGIDGSRIEAIGHGETQPVADNGDTAGRQANRRVEITLVGQQASSFSGM